MAEENETQDTPPKKSGFLGKLIVWGIIFVIGAGAGFAVPMLTGPGEVPDKGVNPGVVGVKLMDFPEPVEEKAFIDFDEVVANLNDPRASRYVNCTLTLQVSKSQEDALTKLVEEKNVLLKNWLIAHLRDKTLEEVRGKYGHNLLRREIHGKFNEMLFTDGIERIEDILFSDFKIQ
ncbi:flagellar basal body-associated FliL family protein [Mariniblastus fucicola]|uniref:Flagellar protein FliL n=1 Tax=Mariniblastus fucicola TaxID=980251 RepID=A0A5B9PAJ1_9BACT|nr:flagellar basal body-associated FliL family protein [Mariniblastus fucicola]QEG23388.1 flagellar basal body-associated protein FliL [Mariniblastus fucicola]